MTDRETILRLLPLYILAAALPVSLSVASTCTGLVLVAAIIVAVRERSRAAWPPRAVLLALTALVAVYLVSVLAAPPAPRHWHKFGEELWIKLMLVAIPVLVGGRVRHLPRLIGVTLVAGGVASLFGIWQHFSGIDPLRGGRSLMTEWGHNSAAAFFGHHLSWGGQLLILILMLAAWLLFTSWRRARLWLVLLLALHGLALAWSYARSPLLGVAVGFVVLVLLLRGRRRLLGAALLVVPALASLALPEMRLHLERLTWMHRHETRLNLWESSLDGIAARPLTGWGPGNFDVMMAGHEVSGYYEVRAHSHNDLLMHGVNAGLPGILAAVALLVAVCWVLFRAWRRGGSRAWLAAGALAVQAGITMAGMFQVYQTDDEVEMLLYVVLGLALAAAGNCQETTGVRHWAGSRSAQPVGPETTPLREDE